MALEPKLGNVKNEQPNVEDQIKNLNLKSELYREALEKMEAQFNETFDVEIKKLSRK